MQAAPPDLLAVAVEEGDGEVLGLQPVVLGLPEGREGERQHHDRADRAEGGRLAGQVEDDPRTGRESAGTSSLSEYHPHAARQAATGPGTGTN